VAVLLQYKYRFSLRTAIDPDFVTFNVMQPDLAVILQALSVKARIFASVKGSHTISSDFIIRYNSRFAGVPGCSPSRSERSLGPAREVS
jgi:hypothetical protein